MAPYHINTTLATLNGTYTNLYRAQMQRSAVSARLLQEILVTS